MGGDGMKDTDDEVRCREDTEGGTGGLLNATGKRGMAAEGGGGVSGLRLSCPKDLRFASTP